MEKQAEQRIAQVSRAGRDASGSGAEESSLSLSLSPGCLLLPGEMSVLLVCSLLALYSDDC